MVWRRPAARAGLVFCCLGVGVLVWMGAPSHSCWNLCGVGASYVPFTLWSLIGLWAGLGAGARRERRRRAGASAASSPWTSAICLGAGLAHSAMPQQQQVERVEGCVCPSQWLCLLVAARAGAKSAKSADAYLDAFRFRPAVALGPLLAPLWGPYRAITLAPATSHIHIDLKGGEPQPRRAGAGGGLLVQPPKRHSGAPPRQHPPSTSPGP